MEIDQNTINIVMKRCAEDPTLLSPEEIDVIIAFQRRAKGQYDATGKAPKKAAGRVDLDNEAPHFTLQSIGLKKETPVINFPKPSFPKP